MTWFWLAKAPISARTLLGFFRVKAGWCISASTRSRPPGKVLPACTLNHWSMTRASSLK
ncbi:hypothetical protein D3C72_2602170 [compost metagenome]